jgi:hypothetical protein
MILLLMPLHPLLLPCVLWPAKPLLLPGQGYAAVVLCMAIDALLHLLLLCHAMLCYVMLDVLPKLTDTLFLLV